MSALDWMKPSEIRDPFIDMLVEVAGRNLRNLPPPNGWEDAKVWARLNLDDRAWVWRVWSALDRLIP